MDVATILVIVGLVGVAVFVILWIRVRALDSIVAEEMTLKVEATRKAINALQDQLSPPAGVEATGQGRKKRRRSRRGKNRS